MKRGPCLLQLEKALMQQWRSSAAINKWKEGSYNLIEKYIRRIHSRMDEIEAWISEPKDKEMENPQTEQQNEKKKKLKKWERGSEGRQTETTVTDN